MFCRDVPWRASTYRNVVCLCVFEIYVYLPLVFLNISTMKEFTVFLLLPLFTLSCFAQTAIPRTYDYDAAGNRILRTIIELRSTKAHFDNTAESVSKSHQSTYYEEVVGKNAVKVFPNPTDGLVTLQFEQPVENGHYQLFNLSGRLLSEGSITTTATIDLSGHPAGAYMLTIRLGDEKETWKIVKR